MKRIEGRAPRALASLFGLIVCAAVAGGCSANVGTIGSSTTGTTTTPTATQFAWSGYSVASIGACTEVYTITSEDSSGEATSVASNTTVNLSGGGSGAFYSDSACTSAITSITIAAYSSSQTFYFMDSSAESLTFSATGTLTAATLPVTVENLSPAKFVWSGVTSGTAGSCTPLTVITETLTGIPANVASDTALTLSSGTGTFYQDSGCTTPASSPTITSGTDSLTLYFQDTASGSMSLSASGSLVTASLTFDVMGGTATQMAFNGSLSTTASAGTNFADPPIVTFEDTYGNTSPSATSAVTISAYTDSGCSTTPASGTLTANANPVTAVSGIATFSNFKYGGTTTTIYLKATATGYTSLCSSAITISAGSAAKLSFSTEPSATVAAGANLATQPIVQVQDAYGNSVSSTKSITLAADLNSTCTSAASGILSATTNPLAATAGVATFAGVSYGGTAGTIYFQASSSGLTSGCSSAIAVTAGTASKLAFSTEPSFDVLSAATFVSQPVVQVEDAYGNVETTDTTDSVTLSPYTDSACSSSGSGLSSTPTVVSSGVATFSGVNYTGNSAIYVGASSGVLTTACSTIVNVVSQSYIAANNSGVHTCAAASTGNNVYCWGADFYGQLGDDTTGVDSCSGSGCDEVPVTTVSTSGSGSLSGIASIAAGADHTCALSTAGNVYCWGNNAYGQLGNGSTNESNFPVEVKAVGGTGNLSDIVAVTAGEYHSCALSSFGNVYCWGYNGQGQLGNNTTTEEKTPVQVLGVGGTGSLASIWSITAGYEHTCALSSSGNVYCWGYDGEGQLGNGATNSLSAPVEVKGVGASGFLSSISSVAAGYEHTCAVSTSNNVYCWGSNLNGQLGNNSITQEVTPVEVLGVGATGDLSGIASVSAGLQHSCALSTGGSVYCWGLNGYGQIGNNTTTQTSVPVQVVSSSGSGTLSGVSSIVVGASHSCAVTSLGDVYCWGQNTYGQLGIDSTSQESFPFEVDGVGGAGFLSGI